MTIAAAEIERLLRERFPAAEIRVTDFVGDGNHFEVRVADSSFASCSLLQQHRMVNEALKSRLDSNELHAVRILTTVKGA